MGILTRGIVRPPASNFADGLTKSTLGPPDYDRALQQHARYCAALEQGGLQVTALPPDSNYPDSTFVEDTAVLTADCFVLARPGAPSRVGEIESMRDALPQLQRPLQSIDPPGTLDGGDVSEAGKHFFIGLSERTDESGGEQLATLLASFGYTASLVDIRGISGTLHLKSALAFLGDGRLAITDSLAQLPHFAGYELVRVPAGEEYAANCVRVNEYVLVAAGFPQFTKKLRNLGYQTIVLEMSEFQKMDGGLSCLSLRF